MPSRPDLLPISCNDEVATALSEGRGVVALETTLIVHGLPDGVNLEVAAQLEDLVRAQGAVPATCGVVEGVAMVGMDATTLERLADPASDTAKLSARDLGLCMARGRSGATTVAGTIALAAAAGVSVMATGGLGGVHRGAAETYDESADLAALRRFEVAVVASGCKSILDIAATLERLDTLGVPIVGHGTDHFPGFYLHATEYELDWRLDDPEAIAQAFALQRQLVGGGMLVANPVGAELALDPALHDQVLNEALEALERQGLSGKPVTPFLLQAMAEATQGRSVEVNRSIVEGNATLAGTIARHLAG